MERRNHHQFLGAWTLIGLALLAISRGLPRLVSAPFAVCVICDVLGFVLLFASVVLGVRAEVRRSGRSTSSLPRD
ncbi:hypothetical protein ACIBL6_22200 [Streptomyces sp. NPDC050400]|uniref:hypothetical protein n=1 Tax=Streptomyces sp. NPDC050400 TaxID=3365610 RepID=UPI0037B5E984